jgi:hypothetical protein
MQAFENPIGADFRFRQLGHKPLGMGCGSSDWSYLGRRNYTPHSQVRTFTAMTAIPEPAATPAKVFLAPGSP